MLHKIKLNPISKVLSTDIILIQIYFCNKSGVLHNFDLMNAENSFTYIFYTINKIQPTK